LHNNVCYSTRKHIICAFYTTLYPNAYSYDGQIRHKYFAISSDSQYLSQQMTFRNEYTGKFYAVIRVIAEYSGKKSQVL